VILYRKAAPLRIRRNAAPEPPFWCATTVAPYLGKRGTTVAIDYPASRASAAAERMEVVVSEDVRNELERARVEPPVLIDATEAAEAVFRRGEETLAWCDEQQLDALYLTSTRGALPSVAADVVAIAAWPLDLARLVALFPSRADEGQPWGVVVPVIYPITTDLAALQSLADAAQEHGASFFAAMPVDVDATAKQAIAGELQLAGSDDRYAMLFHADAAPIHLATERHIAALAAERGMRDFVVPPRWEERSNWNAAVLLTLTASRMIAMEADLDLAGLIARSARAVAELDKPLVRVAEAASLGIIDVLDEVSRDMLTKWLAGGEPSFFAYINEQWRLLRVSGAPP
jgi:hypothetical protein